MAAEEWGVVEFQIRLVCGRRMSRYLRPGLTGRERLVADVNFELPAHAHGRKDAVRCVYEYADFLEDL